jgi:4-diphosphocytidyl-2-C-methyl-D-erythritol kinase
LARANGLAAADPRLHDAAHATGADVPVCLDPRVRLMGGIGEVLSAPLRVPALPAVLVNPGVALATKTVFAGWTPSAIPPVALDLATLAKLANVEEFLQLLAAQTNDLESAAIGLAPAVAEVLAGLQALAGCRIARMSGSGTSCFALFTSAAKAIAAAEVLHAKYPHWWVRATALGSGISPAA